MYIYMIFMPHWLKTNHAHINVEDSTYSYSGFENSTRVHNYISKNNFGQ